MRGVVWCGVVTTQVTVPETRRRRLRIPRKAPEQYFVSSRHPVKQNKDREGRMPP